MRRRGSQAAVVAALVLGAGGCSALLDWSNFSGDAGDGGGGEGSVAEGSAGDGGSDAPAETTPASCGAAMQCDPPLPPGWTGPVALYVAPAAQGAPPPCGAGFAATPAFDGHGGTLTAPPATCSACVCGAVTGVMCNGPVMSPFLDQACSNLDPGVSPVTVTTSCPPMLTLIGVQSVSFSASSAFGGSCTTTGGTATLTAPTWATTVRACTPGSTPGSGGCGAGLVCAPSPASPFASSACVMQAGTASACPAAYPTGPQVFYAGVDDQRGCSACQCTGPSGATCTSPSVDIGTPTGCSGSTVATPSGCTQFTGAQYSAKLTAAPTVIDAGSCSLTGGGVPTSGVVTATGATSFCCAP